MLHEPARGVTAGLHPLLQLGHRRLLELEASGLLCVRGSDEEDGNEYERQSVHVAEGTLQTSEQIPDPPQ